MILITDFITQARPILTGILLVILALAIVAKWFIRTGKVDVSKFNNCSNVSDEEMQKLIEEHARKLDLYASQQNIDTEITDEE